MYCTDNGKNQCTVLLLIMGTQVGCIVTDIGNQRVVLLLPWGKPVGCTAMAMGKPVGCNVVTMGEPLGCIVTDNGETHNGYQLETQWVLLHRQLETSGCTATDIRKTSGLYCTETGENQWVVLHWQCEK